MHLLETHRSYGSQSVLGAASRYHGQSPDIGPLSSLLWRVDEAPNYLGPAPQRREPLVGRLNQRLLGSKGCEHAATQAAFSLSR